MEPTRTVRDDTEMAFVPSGPFVYGITDVQLELLAGSKKRAETFREDYSEPQQDVIQLPSFYIDKYLVTNKQYRRFMKETGYRRQPRLLDSKIWGAENRPVVGIMWPDAQAYAEWCGKRLPSEREWEKAARGVDGRLFPWGNDPVRTMCNCFEAGLENTSEVGAFAASVSPYGIHDMAGNVWEMTSDRWDDESFVMRGGAYLTYVSFCRASARWTPSTEEHEKGPKWLGFRCVCDPT